MGAILSHVCTWIHSLGWMAAFYFVHDHFKQMGFYALRELNPTQTTYARKPDNTTRIVLIVSIS